MELLSEQYQNDTVAVKEVHENVELIHTPFIESTDIDIKRINLIRFSQLKELFKDEPDESIARFLIGKNNDLKLATEMLSNHIKWRIENYPILKQSCLNEFNIGKVYLHGEDKQGRPLIIYEPALNDPKTRNLDEMARMFLWWMQYAVSKLPNHKTKFSVLINRTNSGKKNFDPELSKALSGVFQENFPERLHQCIIYPTGWIFYSMWKMVSIFLDPVTKQKMKPALYPSGVKEFIPDEFIPVSMGGTCTYQFNPDDFQDPPSI